MSGREWRDGEAEARVRVPADVERPDRVLAGLTARQVVILAVAALALWAAYVASRGVVALPVFAALGAPLAVTAAALAFARADGTGLDRLAAHAARHTLRPRRLVPAPDGIPTVPPAVASALGAKPGSPPAPLDLPARGVGADAMIDLGSDGTALVCSASAASFALRSPPERHALVGAFGRWLNSLAGPVQVVVRAEPVDLAPTVAGLRHAAGGLPHPALEAAALGHADFLADLAERTDLLRRQVLVVFREPNARPDDPGRLQRRAGDAAEALAAAGVTLTALDAEAVTVRLAGALDPYSPARPAGLAAPDTVITGAGTTEAGTTGLGTTGAGVSGQDDVEGAAP